MTGTDPDLIERVRSGLLAWFAVNRRDLPWRNTRDPYRILVSEVMLQQTQVDRVIPYYERWLAAFPTVQDLASAPTADVIRLWSGLGYNRRAVNLQRTAQAVVEEHAWGFSEHTDRVATPAWDWSVYGRGDLLRLHSNRMWHFSTPTCGG